MPMDPGMSAKTAEALGLPTGYKAFTPFPLNGMNQQSSRIAIPDNEFYFLENYIRVGDGNIRTLWDRGVDIYTAPAGKTIILHFFYNLGLVNYCIVFLSDGTAVQVNPLTLAQVVVSDVPGTFYITGSSLPACSQWGTLYLVIANNFSPNNYWIWDGGILYTAGELGPVVNITSGGDGYSSPPTVTAFGGSGSGVIAVATISNGSVVDVTLTNPGMGYLPGDQVQFLFTGGGSDNGAQLQAVLTPGTLGSIDVINGGSSYSSPTISFRGGGGEDSPVATLTGTSVDTIVPDGGGVYDSPPTVVISGGGGSGATATAVLTGSAVTSYVVTAPGTGYTSPPTVSLYGGDNATATATVNSGVITGISLTNTGTSFTGSPQVIITDPAGSGAVAIALVSGGIVSSVNIINGGSNFTSTPTLEFVGGGGTGAAATASLTSGVITSVTVTNGGTGYTSAPAIFVETGINNAASATATLMPFGVSGNSLETFEQRVWLGFPNQVGNQSNGGTILVSAPESLTDFSTSDGGLTYVSTDPFLRSRYVNLRQSNGYLYPIADSSCDVISNVQTSGSPATTTFNYQNTDPQIGTAWRDTCADFSRTILFANPLGVYGLYGGSVTKISSKMDSLFTNAVFPENGGVTPCSAVANIFSQKLFLMLMTIKDPFTGSKRNAMISWDEKEWYVASQSTNLTYISTQEVDSDLTAWGTDGNSLFPLFNAPTTELTKTLSTKLYGQQEAFILKQAMGFYLQAQDLSAARTGITFQTATMDNELASYPFENTVAFPAMSTANPPAMPLFACATPDVPGCNLGVTLKTNSPDFAINNLILGYVSLTGIFGSTDITNQTGE